MTPNILRAPRKSPLAVVGPAAAFQLIGAAVSYHATQSIALAVAGYVFSGMFFGGLVLAAAIMRNDEQTTDVQVL